MLLVLDNFEHLFSAPGGNDSGRELLLEMVKMAPKLKLLGQVLARQSWFCMRLSQSRKTKQVLRQSLACFRDRTPDTRVDVAFALCQLGVVEWLVGNNNEAKSLLQESLALSREAGDWFVTELSINSLSYVTRSLGAYAETEAWCREGIALCRKYNDRRGEVFLLNSLAGAANARGDYAQAKQWLQEALIYHRETNSSDSFFCFQSEYVTTSFCYIFLRSSA